MQSVSASQRGRALIVLYRIGNAASELELRAERDNARRPLQSGGTLVQGGGARRIGRDALALAIALGKRANAAGEIGFCGNLRISNV